MFGNTYFCELNNFVTCWPNNNPFCRFCKHNPNKKSHSAVYTLSDNVIADSKNICGMFCSPEEHEFILKKIFINPQEHKLATELIKKFSREEYFALALKSNVCFGFYYPKNRGVKSEFSSLILAVKNQKKAAVEFFVKLLIVILSDKEEFVICVIPSHEAGLKPSGIRDIAKRLCKEPIIDGTDILVRSKTIPSKHQSGVRDLRLERESLDVINKNKIKGRNILLLDDVATTGTSLVAGRSKLLEAGAKSVASIALGHTHITS
ncbi:ComF family protein [Methanolobus chelungpuianus]|uniref:Phosphoribosyltransferase domain-containing protein n=1 Tax=Methanolobus chelungpuianus TaxID=502115 RepID=A0AAE3KY10_9EURY|nr:phosphoribosyltransferase [Methanolobus chelungpuianus]MCQ6962509.1 hypothetical protein [Methanolobus chelungpuianus]